jgi:FkbM family methyltransferase
MLTEAQREDSQNVWNQVLVEHPKFFRLRPFIQNYNMVREIVLGGSVTWRRAHQYFKPFSGALVMDVGANVGVYSAFCASNGAIVRAYEPNRKAFSVLLETINQSGLLIDAVSSVVWTFSGQCAFLGFVSHDECDHYNGAPMVNGVAWNEGTYALSHLAHCISFKEAIGCFTWDCVKMDIEGAEFEVLDSTPIEFLKQIKFMYVELHPWVEQVLYDKVIFKLREVFQFEGYGSDSNGRFEALYLSERLT